MKIWQWLVCRWLSTYWPKAGLQLLGLEACCLERCSYASMDIRYISQPVICSFPEHVHVDWSLVHTLISPASIALSRYRYVLIDAASLMSNSQASSIVHAQIVLMIIEVTCDPYNIVPCVSIYCMHVGFEVQMNACMNTHLCIYIYVAIQIWIGIDTGWSHSRMFRASRACQSLVLVLGTYQYNWYQSSNQPLAFKKLKTFSWSSWSLLLVPVCYEPKLIT